MNMQKINIFSFKNIGLFYLILLSTDPALASDWSVISKQDGSTVLVDMDAYNEVHGLPFIDTKTVYKTPQTSTINGKKLMYLTNIQTTQFDCSAHTYKILTEQFFNKKGSLVLKQNNHGSFQASEKNAHYKSLESLVCQVHRMVGGS